jgi:lysophospholipase L1-like esterase
VKSFFQKNWLALLAPVVIAICVFSVLLSTVPKAPALLRTETVPANTSDRKEVIHYVAIGDSLTEGIGDSTDSGGFVPLVANDLKEEFNLNGVQIDNFGKNGDRSDQILKRLKKNEEIQKGISSADLITVTVGGNDLMKVISGDIFNLTVETFKKPMKSYQKQLTKLLTEIRKYNEEAPVYVLGIYNPFYLYFPDITEMQEIVDNWNDSTKDIVMEQKKMYFVPINDLLYKGKGNEVGIVADEETNTSSSTQDSLNNVLYEEDRFHPNNLGYQLMASAVRDEMMKTKKQWLIKTESSENIND